MPPIKRAAILGAGAMGTAIAAHLANAGVPSLLLDMVPAEATDDERAKGLDAAHCAVRNRLALQGIDRAAKSNPASFGHKSRVGLLTAGNFEDDLAKLAEADWVVEAVVENLEVKEGL
ncbi:MAG: 3-hydroxyacyl-CoA dehydrogenase, partial [Deltaproteobacteria bacterium]|nr:3-hydroxyacyl-CoA dehydrogenase [Deltaproteobacteria bacterium]